MLATLNILERRTTLRMDIGLYVGTTFWALLKSIYYIGSMPFGLTRNTDGSSYKSYIPCIIYHSLYHILHTICSILYQILYTMYSIPNTTYYILYTIDDMACTLYHILHAIYSMTYTIHLLLYTIGFIAHLPLYHI